MNAFYQKIGRYIINKIFGPVLKVLGLKPSREEFIQTLRAEEAKIGASLFGKAPVNAYREFYRYDEQTWIWSERAPRPDGSVDKTIINYVVTDDGILKITPNFPNQVITGAELENFYRAVMAYSKQVKQLYATL